VVCFKNIKNLTIFDLPDYGYKIPAVFLDNKTIFFVVIDICSDTSTPSQTNKANNIEIRMNDFQKEKK